jgi:hypothetical protein
VHRLIENHPLIVGKAERIAVDLEDQTLARAERQACECVRRALRQARLEFDGAAIQDIGTYRKDHRLGAHRAALGLHRDRAAAARVDAHDRRGKLDAERIGGGGDQPSEPAGADQFVGLFVGAREIDGRDIFQILGCRERPEHE